LVAEAVQQLGHHNSPLAAPRLIEAATLELTAACLGVAQQCRWATYSAVRSFRAVHSILRLRLKGREAERKLEQ
jgi:hypothetical protein